jgi:hypothetical protein
VGRDDRDTPDATGAESGTDLEVTGYVGPD